MEQENVEETPAMVADTKIERIPYILNGELYKIITQEGENVTVKCSSCPPERVYRGSVRSTGNFHMHIKRRHPNLMGRLHEMKVSALLERRDRLMLKRNTAYRGKRNKNSSIIKQEDSPNHSLKIKAAFQRHQRQQKEAMKQRHLNSKPNSSESVVQLEAINCSIKQDTKTERSEDDKQEIQKNIKTSENKQALKEEFWQSLLQQQSNMSTELNSGRSTPVHDETSNDTAQHASGGLGSSATMSLVDYAPLMVNQTPLDLSMSTKTFESKTSGVATSASLSAFESNNNLTVSNVANTAAAAGSASIDFHLKYMELLQQLNSNVANVQQELQSRNQIEMKRLYLDIAKFKHFNRDFTFNL